MDNKILVVCGPTATGKTKLAIHLANIFDGELVSADSRQIYKGMDIGTGKDMPKKISNHKSQIPNLQIKNKKYTLIPYEIDNTLLWMVDIVNPDEEFSVAQYEYLAGTVIDNIRKRGKLAIVVGGTGLYINALLSPFETSHIPMDKILRQELQALSIEELQEKLQETDPVTFKKLNPSDRQNSRRLVRKIEIALWRDLPACRQAVRPSFAKATDGQVKSNVFIVGLTAPFAELYRRIDQRVEQRVHEGVIKEIQSLLDSGYTWDLPSMNTFGYKEWKEYFNASPETRNVLTPAIIQRWKWDEHAYARRQMTWFRKQNDVEWYDVRDGLLYQSVEHAVGIWYTKKYYAQKN